MKNKKPATLPLEPRNDYGIRISGFPLDGETQNVITFDMLENLHSILCYDYEDGKPWYDLTCVMEVIFRKVIYEDGSSTKVEKVHISKIRYLYTHPWQLFADFQDLAESFDKCYSLATVRMDLTAGWCMHDCKDCGINFDDFETFNCTIKHKKRFHTQNPDMPYD